LLFEVEDFYIPLEPSSVNAIDMTEEGRVGAEKNSLHAYRGLPGMRESQKTIFSAADYTIQRGLLSRYLGFACASERSR
jgi:hypothetical protein